MGKRFILLSLIAMASSAQAADFTGQSFTAAYEYPSSGIVYAPGQFAPASFTVGSGTETVGNVEDVTTIDVDFTATTLTLSLSTILTNPTWTYSAFNGPVFSSAAHIPFTGVALGAGTTLAGFDLSRVTLSDHQIRVNWGGLTYNSGSAVELIFSGGVPEPASWMMMIGGFGATGAMMRAGRRRNSSKVTFA